MNKEGVATTVPQRVSGYSGQARPSEAVQDFRRADHDSSTMSFAWTGVTADSSVNGKFEGYKVRWCTVVQKDEMDFCFFF